MEEKNNKSLLEVFKELENSKDKQVEIYKRELEVKKETKEAEKSDSFVFHIKHRTTKDNVLLILIVLILLLSVSMFSSNYIFAADLVTEEEKSAIGTFEQNEEETDVYAIISENISVSYQKQVVEVEEEIEYETEYIENKDMPKDEEFVEQEGSIGSKIVTYVRTYENNEMSDEKIIGTTILEEPVTEKIQVGTSEALANFQIHIGDSLYATSKLELKKEPDEDSATVTFVKDKYDVTTIEVVDDVWMKVEYAGKKGYLKCEDLTSEALTPGSAEACRKQKIYNTVSEDMELNEVSGLSLNDFKNVFENNSKDVNDVFKENYAAFYAVEYKYNINGVFVAAIAIHESAWATSSIAVNKKNLFGYGAYDSSPYESAVTFDSYADGIETVAKWLAINYLNESGVTLPSGDQTTGRYYNGATVAGVNTRYATDTNWSNRVFEIMQDIYNSI